MFRVARRLDRGAEFFSKYTAESMTKRRPINNENAAHTAGIIRQASSCGRRQVLRGALAAALVMTSGWAAADQVDVAGKTYPRGRLLGIEGGTLKFRLESSEILSIDFDELQRVHVDPGEEFADFNAAEEFVAGGEPEKSIVRYERQLRTAEGFWADLIKVRLVRACDLAGQIDKAVHYFCRVLDDDLTGAAVAARIMPDRVPGEMTMAARHAVEQLERATGRRSQDARKVLTLVLKYDVLRRAGDARADVIAPIVADLVIPGEVFTPRVGRIFLSAIETLAARGDAASALAGIDRAMSTVSDAAAPDLLLMKGRVLAGDGASRENLIRAGWAFMRVVIHYAKDARAAEALVEAAEIHRRLGRTEQAQSLSQECLRRGELPEALQMKAKSLAAPAGSAAPD